ncbi:hypothetical protein [Xanthocytophaga agilis]|uniref:Uncharacterized protein n=1 Tax=Xanthocytophaga agilis TaxID=3048010 RepID=A0AAE3R4G5_9BACT|nr:hypothetical protein [Xanthocytophaga agilis]MDJ1500512.1 hypothetical protein [Xanthocytophaga agilis]
MKQELKWILYVFAGLTVIGYLLVKSSKPKTAKFYTDTNEITYYRSPADFYEDTIHTPTRPNKEILQRGIDALKKPMNLARYKTSKDSILMEVDLFDYWDIRITDGELSDDPEEQKLALVLRSKLLPLRLKEFPLMRKAWVDLLNQKLRKQGIEASIRGKDTRTIRFVGALLHYSYDEEDLYDSLEYAMQSLRFNNYEYLWYESQKDYLHYQTKTSPD